MTIAFHSCPVRHPLGDIKRQRDHLWAGFRGFRFFAEKIADRLGFDRFQSNDLGIADNKLDGTVTDPILGRAAKADIMRNWSKELAFHRLSFGRGRWLE